MSNNESGINYRSFGTSKMRDQNKDNSYKNYCDIRNSHKSIDQINRNKEFKTNNNSRNYRRLDSKSDSRFK
jgi:hypothetical protein